MKSRLHNILKGKFLVSEDAFKNWRMILFLSLLALVMIASSHSADRKVHDIAKLKDEVKELHSMFVEGRSELMRLKKETVVELKMKEKGIYISEIPPTKIIVKSSK
ncbi:MULTISPECIES: FtsL-like putative cell division protein [Mangrovimonas]|uniref:S-adenosyl-methyltransferase n=2 Tax=Mangrovimonas TaxID=1211036 RepID=A0A428K666_9FLAO|nr:FtsL-like putative cell division protein [Mangrovimonas spongiae]RSK41954.1 S-adenosyl-methyltransferase [Mangrovimonas spongiae]